MQKRNKEKITEPNSRKENLNDGLSVEEICSENNSDEDSLFLEAASDNSITTQLTLAPSTSSQPNFTSTSTTLCLKCNSQKRNKDCKLSFCQSCCSSSPEHCTVSAHSLGKVELFAKTYLQLVQNAISNQSVLYIQYKGKNRALKPLSWAKQNCSFNALEIDTNCTKTFHLLRISDANVNPLE